MLKIDELKKIAANHCLYEMKNDMYDYEYYFHTNDFVNALDYGIVEEKINAYGVEFKVLLIPNGVPEFDSQSYLIKDRKD